MLRPIAGAMIRSSAIKWSNCDGNIDCAPSLSARSGSGVNFDEQAVGTGGDRGPGHRRYLVSEARTMARGRRQRVSDSVCESPGSPRCPACYACSFQTFGCPLAEDNVGIPTGQQVLG